MAAPSGAIRQIARMIGGGLVAAAALGRARAGAERRGEQQGIGARGDARSGNSQSEQGGRGRDARTPTGIPPRGLKDVLWRLYSQISKDRVLLVAAGITFYGILALFPALTALISIYGLFSDPAAVATHLKTLSTVLPEGAIDVIGGQLDRLTKQPRGSLGFGFAAGLAVALWSANNGMKALFEGLNVAYGEAEKRSFLRLTAVTLLFTLGAIATLITGMGVIVAIPILLNFLGLDFATETLVRFGRWLLLFVILIVGIGLLYRYGPSRRSAQWRWLSPGSLIAAVAWVVVSVVFSWYVSNFGSYNETYGTLGAVIGFMVWMWISATIILMGAELNAELEHQTARDTTVPGDRKMGRRGAEMADTLGEAAE